MVNDFSLSVLPSSFKMSMSAPNYSLHYRLSGSSAKAHPLGALSDGILTRSTFKL